jgi:DNA-binding XRE family transcriptional regulator
MKNPEVNRRLPNYIRIHRRRSGLTQQELCGVLGREAERAVARHEKFLIIPSLELAIAYEIVFRLPVAEMFAGLHDDVAEGVEARLARLEQQLGERNARDRNASATARKLIWLAARRSTEYEPLA